jgi:hypothetical protein
MVVPDANRFRRGACLRQVLTDVANELRDKGVLDEEESFIDATFAMAKGGGAEIGPTKRGKGMKIMAIVDRHGLPLSVSTHAANHHEVRLVQLCFDFYMIEAKPETLVGDRAYDSDPLDDELRKDGIEMVAPHRYNRRKRATQDGRRLRRYARRWLVGVSSEGHAVMSVKVRPEPKDSGFEAREAPWRESKTAEPSDNMLERSMREASGCNVQ